MVPLLCGPAKELAGCTYEIAGLGILNGEAISALLGHVLTTKDTKVTKEPITAIYLHKYRYTIYNRIQEKWSANDIIRHMENSLSAADYQSLAELRYQIRNFLHFSEQAAREAGLEPHQHQLLLAIKGLPKGVRPRIGDLAERLKIRHHSTVELANRLVSGGYVKRHRGIEDRREVLLSLTPKGGKVLRELALHHWTELRTAGPMLLTALSRVVRRVGTAKTTIRKR